jgi:hypothetical protein
MWMGNFDRIRCNNGGPGKRMVVAKKAETVGHANVLVPLNHCRGYKKEARLKVSL